MELVLLLLLLLPVVEADSHTVVSIEEVTMDRENWHRVREVEPEVQRYRPNRIATRRD